MAARRIIKKRSPKTPEVLRGHFSRRAVERLGLTLTRKDMDAIRLLIWSGKSTGQVQSHTRSKHTVNYNDITFDVIYDKLRKTVVTVLPSVETR